jgi:hypothetical protein
LTRILLRQRLSAPIVAELQSGSPPLEGDVLEKALNKRLESEKFNRTTLMIDPFPSEKRDKFSAIQESEKPNAYPYSFMGAIGQLLSTMRTQLLVKANLLEKGFDETNFDCFLIAPRRRVYKTDEYGKPIKKGNHFVSEFEKNPDGTLRSGPDGNPIPKAYDGSAAIACGSLWGFGGFLARSFREHDFFLGRINCQSFLRHHFRIPEENIKDSIFKNAYESEAKNIFRITETSRDAKNKVVNQYFYPIIPDVPIIDKIIDGKTVDYFQERKDIDQLYGKLDYPEYNMKKFYRHRKELKRRLSIVMYSPLKMYMRPFYIALAKPVIWLCFHLWFIKWLAYLGICQQVKKALQSWQLVKKTKTE